MVRAADRINAPLDSWFLPITVRLPTLRSELERSTLVPSVKAVPPDSRGHGRERSHNPVSTAPDRKLRRQRDCSRGA
jgi:hypothetical protein